MILLFTIALCFTLTLVTLAGLYMEIPAIEDHVPPGSRRQKVVQQVDHLVHNVLEKHILPPGITSRIENLRHRNSEGHHEGSPISAAGADNKKPPLGISKLQLHGGIRGLQNNNLPPKPQPQNLSSGEISNYFWEHYDEAFTNPETNPGARAKSPYPYPLDVVPESYNIKENFKVLGGSRFLEYTSGRSPHDYSANRQQSDVVARSRRYHVKAAMQHAWQGYTTYAFGQDEVLPQSAKGSNNWGGQGITLVDSLDTLWLMNMTTEFSAAKEWVAKHLDHSHVGSVSVFETTIRDLGGLLSAYDWSGDTVFLEHAVDLGRRLLHAFDNDRTGIPYGQVNLQNHQRSNIGWTGDNAILAEAGTVQLEFRYLAHVTGHKELCENTDAAFKILRNMRPSNGLYPYYIQNDRGATPTFANDKLTFGAMADSFYEYMLKVWLLGGKVDTMYREMYDESMEGMHSQLLQYSTPSGLVYIADRNGGRLDTKMDHLVCFMGGLLALGAYTDPLGLDSRRAQRDLRTAKALTYTCYQMYARMETGISAEFVQFYAGRDFESGSGAPHYLLRPEAAESLFVLNQLTGDPVYREWGWEMFQAIEKYCRTNVAYGSLDSVHDVNGRPRDKMESFFLAETLKYLYLLQDPGAYQCRGC
jgi:mannosyl-oligosaccharide alpha-1,2-mannosidase